MTTITFPAPTSTRINMMPIIFGDSASIPTQLHGYLPMLAAAHFTQGDTVYLTVDESYVPAGATQRRAGIHTDATNRVGWGGGHWGGNGGIYLASTDGLTSVWSEDVTADDVDDQGGLLHSLTSKPEHCQPNTLYRIGDQTPHASIASTQDTYRQFFRLVGHEIGVWYSRHSTPNPFGVLPCAPIVTSSKF